MPIPDPASRRRLAAMGIEVWALRTTPREPLSAQTSWDAGEAEPDSGLRIRMASGTGRWLLVQGMPWSGEHETLLADIMATLGPQECRFGQWAVSDSAGVDLEGLKERGVEHVLAFGEVPRPVEHDRVHRAPALEELAQRPEARRRLWQILAPHLDG